MTKISSGEQEERRCAASIRLLLPGARPIEFPPPPDPRERQMNLPDFPTPPRVTPLWPGAADIAIAGLQNLCRCSIV